MIIHMEKTTVHLKNYIGTSYEVGTQIGNWALANPNLLKNALIPPDAYPLNKFTQIIYLLDQYCPGINDEIKVFSDTVGVTAQQAVFYAMTYLERGCSLMAALPSKTESGHTLMARNYDFHDKIEEMCLAYTDIKNKYKYIGSTMHLFGRGDGMNEHGLAVCQAGNGLPVGNFKGGQKPGATGFQLWIVLRSILKNCKNIDEAIGWAHGSSYWL